jgi:2-polyprenyl-3-methyl-5-hydroxy-6-metoxy-1,4-benzoquinol methylase
MIKKTAKRIINQIRRSHEPDYLTRNQIKLDVSQLKRIEISIRKNYHQGWRSEQNYTGETYDNDLKTHLIERLEFYRNKYIPWFNKIIPLKDCNVLEIGCGTGSSTVSLAEQGANVTGIDFDEGALKVARERCEIYNVPATLIYGNASEVYKNLLNHKYDIIIFLATIEHMTYSERIICLQKYYNLLPSGAYLSIINSPNRLWYFDHAVSVLPFFHWLPDNVAFDYSKYSKRINFKDMYLVHSEEMLLHFLRRGRGFSYHELEIALNIPAENLNVINYIGRHFSPNSLDNKFHNLLVKINPKISKGFFYPNIDIMLRK